MRSMMIATLLLAGCGTAEGPVLAQAVDPTVESPAAAVDSVDSVDSVAAAPAAPAEWSMASSGEGVALVADDEAGTTVLLLFCPAGSGRLVVNAPGFEPVGSEDRLSLGQEGEVEALVVDPSGDPDRGGVTGEGPVPGNLQALLSGQVSASYGAQVSGPHTAPPADLVTAFASGCVE